MDNNLGLLFDENYISKNEVIKVIMKEKFKTKSYCQSMWWQWRKKELVIEKNGIEYMEKKEFVAKISNMRIMDKSNQHNKHRLLPEAEIKDINDLSCFTSLEQSILINAAKKKDKTVKQIITKIVKDHIGDALESIEI